MAHSRIFMISQSPIDPDDYISEDVCYPEGGDWSFVGNIADYVDEETDREEDIQWLKEVLTNAMKDKVEFNDEEKSFVFKTGFREEYFKDKKEAFLEVVEKMKSGEPDWGFETQLFASAALGYINDKWSFYFYDNGFFHQIDSFIRNTGANVKFYIGNTIDYHY